MKQTSCSASASCGGGEKEQAGMAEGDGMHEETVMENTWTEGTQQIPSPCSALVCLNGLSAERFSHAMPSHGKTGYPGVQTDHSRI